MTYSTQDGPNSLPSGLPEPVQHSFFGFRKSVRAEIGSLRAFAEKLLVKATPGGYAQSIAERDEAEQRASSLRQIITNLEKYKERLNAEITEVSSRIAKVRDLEILQEVGIYEYRHDMESSDEYKDRIKTVRSQYKDMAKQVISDVASNSRWTVNGSEAKGRKMIRDTFKLLLRAYNNEADMLVDKLRPFKLEASLERLDKSRNAVNRLGAEPMGISIPARYHQLRKSELELAADWLAKKEEEREAARAEQDRLRDERQAERELVAQKAKLDKERQHYRNTIERLREKHAASGSDTEELADLEVKLAEIQANIESVDWRAANIRAGHVYVISNIGSFGDQVVKIGMTRRLDPMDRVKELGDASVPFRFDVHAMVFADDAVTLEGHLHDRLSDCRVNLVNLRREFFYASPNEVMEAVKSSDLVTRVLDYTEIAEAEEWRTSENTRKLSDERDTMSEWLELMDDQAV